MSNILDERVPQKPEYLYEIIFNVAKAIDIGQSAVYITGVGEPRYSPSAETQIKIQESRKRTHTDKDGDSFSQFEEAITFATVTVQPLGTESRIRVKVLDSKPSGGFESFLDDQPKYGVGADIQVWTESDFDRKLFLLEFAYQVMYESAGTKPASDWLSEAIDTYTSRDTNLLRDTTTVKPKQVHDAIVDYLNNHEDEWKGLLGKQKTLNLESSYRRFSIYPVSTKRKVKQVEGASRVDLLARIEYLVLGDEVAVLMEVLDEGWRSLLKGLSAHLTKTLALKRILSVPPIIDMGSGYSTWEVERMRGQNPLREQPETKRNADSIETPVLPIKFALTPQHIVLKKNFRGSVPQFMHKITFDEGQTMHWPSLKVRRTSTDENNTHVWFEFGTNGVGYAGDLPLNEGQRVLQVRVQAEGADKEAWEAREKFLESEGWWAGREIGTTAPEVTTDAAVRNSKDEMSAQPDPLSAPQATQSLDGVADPIATNPWLQIPEHAWDRKALELWCKGYSSADIGRQVSATGGTVLNRLSQLRKEHGNNIVPTDEQRKRMGFSNP